MEVFAAGCETYDEKALEREVGRIFESFGGVKGVLEKGDRVLIKPNLLMARAPASATTTHPALVFAVASALVKAGARVTIADSPGGPYNQASMSRVYKLCGMSDAARRSGAALNSDFTHGTVRGGVINPRDFSVISPVLNSDTVISVCKMKSHMFMHFTGGVKNMFGVIPGVAKAMCHSKYPKKEDFAALLVDLCLAVKPDFTIMDGIEGMDGKGPSGGRVRKGGVIFGSKDPFALDTAAMRHCGISPETTPVHAQSLKAGVILPFEMTGDDIPPLSEPFEMPMMQSRGGVLNLLDRLHKGRSPYPQMTGRCTGCGDCARACPEKAIKIEGKRAVLNKKGCIRCYCCHELCPVQAIDLNK